MRYPRFKLSTIIIISVCLVVLLSIGITDILITNTTSNNIKKQLEDKALNVSRTVSKSQVVINDLQSENKEGGIQDYAMTIQEATNVMFVVVMDMSGIRYSHPVPSQIGNHFVGGDEKRVLQGKEYTSTSTGTLGKSLRAFTPIYNKQQEQIGAVAVGISLEDIQTSIRQNQKTILFVSVIGVIIGVIGALLLARYIKNSLFGLEPHSIARIFEERNRILHFVHEGIIAIDNQGNIVLVNQSAQSIFLQAGIMEQDPIGMKIDDFLPTTQLMHTLESQEADLNMEQSINGISIITNRVPLIVNDQLVGAIATFRDKTEVNRLAKQLTGVQNYADTLRSQSHEFMNQLHVLLGMIKMEEYQKVEQFITKLVNHKTHEIGSIIKYIKDPTLAGFMIGKQSFARESQVHLELNCETEIPMAEDQVVTHELITIIGNVIDNSIESVKNRKEKWISLTISYIDGLLSISITDTGVGIPEDKMDEVFKKGVSMKEGYNNGFGLYLVQNSIEKLEGSLDIDSTVDSGTTISMIVPYEAGGKHNDKGIDS